MTTHAKPNNVLLVQVEERYGTKRLAAYVQYETESGEFRNYLWSSIDRGAEYAGFRIAAYIDSGMGADTEGVWGPSYGYEDETIMAVSQAAAIHKVMRKVENGLERITSEEGWLTHGDVALYFLRVARVLGIKRFRIRSHPRRAAMSGSPFYVTDGSGLQSFITNVDRDARDGKIREYIAR